jgi:hypothetical protein
MTHARHEAAVKKSFILLMVIMNDTRFDGWDEVTQQEIPIFFNKGSLWFSV